MYPAKRGAVAECSEREEEASIKRSGLRGPSCYLGVFPGPRPTRSASKTRIESRGEATRMLMLGRSRPKPPTEESRPRSSSPA
jgi:hypothetical protein